MDVWWYKIDGVETEWPDTAGIADDIPAAAEFMDVDFLNQFIDRLNLRIAANRMIGDRTVSIVARLEEGTQAMKIMGSSSGSFVKNFIAQFAAIDNFWIGPDDPTSAADSDGYYVGGMDSAAGTYLSAADAVLAGDDDFAGCLKNMRIALDKAKKIARKPSMVGYDWDNSRTVYGLAGAIVGGFGKWRLLEPVTGDDPIITTGGFTYPYYPEDKIETLSGDGDFSYFTPAGRGKDSFCWMIQAYSQFVRLFTPTVDIGYNLSAYFKGTKRVLTPYDYDADIGYPDEDVFVASNSDAFVTDYNVREVMNLTGTFGSLTEITDEGDPPQSVCHVLGMVMIEIDEDTTPQI